MGVIRTVLAVDGERNFKSVMKEVNSTLKAMQANVKALSSEYIKNGEKVKQLNRLNDQLKEIEAQQSEKKKLLTAQVQRSGEAYEKAKDKLKDMCWLHGQESEEAEKARRAVSSAAVTYNNYRTQLSQTEEALNETRDAIRQNNEEINRIEKSSKSFTQQLKSMGSVLSNVGKTAGKVAKAEFEGLKVTIKAVSTEFSAGIKGVTAYGAALGASVAAVGKFSMDSGATLEQSVSKLKAISKASAEDMEKLEAAAKKTGATTSKTAAESADALTYMALAGWKTEDMLKGLNPIVKASEAGNMDLATASDLVTDSLAAYGKTADDLPKYLDVITAAQSNSNTSMQQMLEAYVEVGGTFKNLNVPIEESASVLGILANRGIKGSEAGNKLSSTLVNLIGANKNAASALEDLGVSAWDSEGNFIGLTETVRALGTKLSEMSVEEMTKFEAKIGGKMQIDTLQALIAGTTNEFDDLVQKLEDSKGALNETSAEMLDNFKGAVTITKSAIEALGNSLFSTFGKQLRENVQSVGKAASALSSTIENNGSIVGIINKIAAESKKQLKKNIRDIAESLPDITEIFNTVILKSIDIANGAAKQSKYTIRTIFSSVIGGFSELMGGLIERLPETVGLLAEQAKILFENLIPNMQELAGKITDALPQLIESVRTYISGEGIAQTYLAGVDILMSVINGIADTLPVLISEARNMIMTFITGMVERLPEIFQTGIEILLELINGITDMLPELITAAVDILLALVDAIINNLDEILDVALKIVLALLDGIINNIDKIIDKVPDILLAIVNAIIDNLDLIVSAAVKIIDALVRGIFSAVGYLWDSIVGISEGVEEKFLEMDWGEVGSNILKGIADGFSNIGSYVWDKVKGAGNAIVSSFKEAFDIHSPSKRMKEEVGKYVGQGAVDGAVEGIEDRDYKFDEASAKLSAATKRAFIDVSANVDTGMSRGVTQVFNFDNVNIYNDDDLDSFAKKLAAKTRSYTLAEG